MAYPPFLFRDARLGAVFFFATHSIAPALDLTFPTQNRALLQGDGGGFICSTMRFSGGEIDAHPSHLLFALLISCLVFAGHFFSGEFAIHDLLSLEGY